MTADIKYTGVHFTEVYYPLKKEKRLNPKKNKSARRQRSLNRVDLDETKEMLNSLPDHGEPCKTCNLKSRVHGSSRCQQCSDELNNKKV